MLVPGAQVGQIHDKMPKKTRDTVTLIRLMENHHCNVVDDSANLNVG